MDWMKIGSAVALGLMLIYLFPRAKAMLNQTPPAQPGDWHAALVPLIAVVGFVVLLMAIV